MLAQLVCTDRRYARMNCFNIRELQTILKTKFFTDLVSSHDHRAVLSNSMIGLRFHHDNGTHLNLDTVSFFNYGLHHTTTTSNHTTPCSSSKHYTLDHTTLN